MQLVVFDLDFTLWNAGGTWCDHTCPPYKRTNGHVIDSNGSKIVLYPDVREILWTLKLNNITMGLASRTGAPDWANELLKLLEIEHFFTHKEIYPGSKIEHFNQLQHATNIPFEKMIFYDDESRNIEEVGQMGVKAILVDYGIDWGIINSTLDITLN
ncbi:MAG: magnesium-dependent phosphatase-1 [Bacteroidales bacterium]|nr:magnesium-dependent phosphatase-1 [Bacteroidales bacterium]